MHGCHHWLTDLQPLLVHGDDAVLISIARTEGDAPREPGVKMVVARDKVFHTIGGGALEWHAIDTARRLLRESSHAPHPTRHLERVTLEASHGSVVTLAYERLNIGDLGWVSALAKRYHAGVATVRTVSFADPTPVLLSDTGPATLQADCLLWDAGPLLTETLVAPQFPVAVFGAGHVGSALIRVLATLPCQVTWIDDRAQHLSSRVVQSLPEHIVARLESDPPECVTTLPAASYVVVATYSTALDQAIVERVVRRADHAYLGVVGTAARRRSIDHALIASGIDPAQLSRLHCPVGLPGIQHGSPEIMAISIAAQLLQTHEGSTHAHRVGAASFTADAGGIRHETDATHWPTLHQLP